jgi:phosphoserine phosphatase RsbU/P
MSSVTSVPSKPPIDDDTQRLLYIVDMMRDMSRHTDPQEMVRSYGKRIQVVRPTDGRISLSRRGLRAPDYRVTRSTTWSADINPWKEKDRLPLHKGGLFAELLYKDEPRIIDDLQVDANDPAARYVGDNRSLAAIPMFDQGVALNMVLLLRKEPGSFAMSELPELVWMSNLFGRATNTLVLSEQLQQAYQALDREFALVGEIQRSLLPSVLPKIPTMDLAAHYHPSQQAGGDYYDFFELPEGKWGVFIADVSGHGTPAAVLMAITHCIAHSNPCPASRPQEILSYLNRCLATRYTAQNENFVTAFYAVYDPSQRTLTYSRAGHNPPRLKRCQDGTLVALNAAGGLPLGINTDSIYHEAVHRLLPGDQIIFYTDGITEAHSPDGEMFTTERLDRELENCSLEASALLESVLVSVRDFTAGLPTEDDQTMIVARII